ncbi:hypothetical protein AVEN_156400-1, partial [Araneus ventricosus]
TSVCFVAVREDRGEHRGDGSMHFPSEEEAQQNLVFALPGR